LGRALDPRADANLLRRHKRMLTSPQRGAETRHAV
jgi:hypothetical protein